MILRRTHTGRSTSSVYRSSRRKMLQAAGGSVQRLESRLMMSTTYYVDPVSGNDTTGTGTSASPFQSIQYAVDESNSASGPTHILLKTGVYRVDGSDLPSNEPSGGIYQYGLALFNGINGTSGAHSSIEAAPGANVWLSGSSIYHGTWTYSGTTGVYYTTYTTNSTTKPIPSQVFLNWSITNNVAPLTQIGTTGNNSAYYGDAQRIINGVNGYTTLPANAFWYDTTSSKLYVNFGAAAPTSTQVEISDMQNVMWDPSTPTSLTQYVDFNGLNIVHTDSYNPSASGDDPDAVRMPTNSTFNNGSVSYTDFAGLTFGTLTTNVTINNSTFANNGQSGVQAAGTQFLVENSQFNNNNTRRFEISTSGASGGIKVISNRPTPTGTIENNIAANNNHSAGIWLDTLSGFSPIVVKNNYVHDNGGQGIDVEATQNAQIYNNVVINNADGGIALNASAHTDIYNNTLVGNSGNAAVEFSGGSRVVDAFADGDIGSVGLAGSGNFAQASGTTPAAFIGVGSGADIAGTSDAFHFSNLPTSGDQTLIAEVTSQTNTDPWAKAGLMIRNGLSASDAQASVVLTPGNGVYFEWRATSGGPSNGAQVTGITGPIYLKLVRSSSNFSGYYSSNGSSWTQIGTTQSITMGSPTYSGLAVTSHNNSLLSTATFTNVDVIVGTGSLINFSTTGNAVVNNLIANNNTTFEVAVTTSGTSNVLSNNLYYRRGGPLQFTTGGTYEGLWGPTYTTLAQWQTATSQDSGSVSADPLFLTGGSGALAYKPGSTSAANHSGANLYSIVTTDYSGTARPTTGNFDIGAFQVGSTAGTAGPVVVNSDSTVWVDDTLPTHAAPTPPQAVYPNQEVLWNWTTAAAGITPDSGVLALDSGVQSGQHDQYFLVNSSSYARTLNTGDVLFARVYVDPSNLPSEIMLQFNDGTGWEHRAFWGANNINLGTLGTASRYQVSSSVPTAGGWMTISVPISSVGFTGGNLLYGVTMSLYNGRALFDRIGSGQAAANVVGLSATRASTTQINLAWTAATDSAGFTVQRSTDRATWTTVTTLAGTATGYSDTGLTANTVYYYRVQSFNVPGTSFWSVPVTAATTPVAETGGSILGTSSTTAQTINLTTLGTGDWAKWSTVGLVTKASVSTAIGTLVPTDWTFASGTSPDSMSWTDGTPTTSGSGVATVENIGGVNGIGGSLVLPADTNVRTVTVFLAGYYSTGIFTAQLSDGSATFAPQTVSFSSGLGAVTYTVTYDAATSNQTLLLGFKLSGTSGWVGFDSATLAAGAGVIVPSLNAVRSSSTQVNVTWGSAYGAASYNVQRSTELSTWTTIATPTTTSYNDTGRTSGTVYYYRVQSSTTRGNSLWSEPVSAYTSSSAITGGSLSTATSSANQTATLSTVGTSDWVKWLSTGNVRKSGVTQLIGNLTGTDGGFASVNSPDSMSWTGGTPTASSTGTSTELGTGGEDGIGGFFTVPADTTSRTLTVYLAGFYSTGVVTARLSDGSATTYTDTNALGGPSARTYTFTYKAGTSGQTLLIGWRMSADAGWVGFDSAALVVSGGGPMVVHAVQPAITPAAVAATAALLTAPAVALVDATPRPLRFSRFSSTEITPVAGPLAAVPFVAPRIKRTAGGKPVAWSVMPIASAALN